jgi:myo-inositol-1(or 4)-monophosphatase
MDLDSLERTAVRAAYRGAEVLRARYGKLSSIEKKGPSDLVTDADFASETEIVATIRAAFPDHAIVAEESGVRDGAAEWRWLVDPLDGTVNYAHQVPFFAVSIACVQGDEGRLGVVLNPVSGELFTARSGGGARKPGSRKVCWRPASPTTWGRGSSA